MTEEQQEEIVAALEAAVAGLECGAPDEDAERGFIAAWNALFALGRRDERIGPTTTPDGREAAAS